MPGVIDPETINANTLPAVWSPVQWALDDAERAEELEVQAVASLLWAADAPESILRLLLGETKIARAYQPPEGYDPALQGEWDESVVTFEFRRPVRLLHEERSPTRLYLEYQIADRGVWALEIEAESVQVRRL